MFTSCLLYTSVEVKERENVIADRMMQVKQLYVREGDQVEKGDPLFQTSYGDDVKSSIDGEVTQLDVDPVSYTHLLWRFLLLLPRAA